MDDSLEVAGLKADSEASREAIEGAKASILRYAMPPEGYNGWTNHATWSVNLYLSEDPERVADLYGRMTECESLWLASDVVREDCERVVFGQEDGLESFGGVDFDLVNWPEIAANLLSSADPA